MWSTKESFAHWSKIWRHTLLFTGKVEWLTIARKKFPRRVVHYSETKEELQNFNIYVKTTITKFEQTKLAILCGHLCDSYKKWRKKGKGTWLMVDNLCLFSRESQRNFNMAVYTKRSLRFLILERFKCPILRSANLHISGARKRFVTILCTGVRLIKNRLRRYNSLYDC